MDPAITLAKQKFKLLYYNFEVILWYILNHTYI